MKYLLVLLLLTSSITAKAQDQKTINIPDPNFEIALINKGFDFGKPDGKVFLSNIENAENLDFRWIENPISNLKGIEHFKNLKDLMLDANNLSELDLSQNLQLEVLSLGGNDQISKVDLSKNTALKHLYLYHHDAGSCNIKSIDLSNNVNLETLYFDSNTTESINLTHNTKLVELRCTAPWGRNPDKGLKVLDLSKNIQLEQLDCSGNQLEKLDLSNNLKLNYLACSNNKLAELNIDKNIQLQRGFFSHNFLTKLNVNKNIQLEYLSCGNNKLTELNLKENTALENLDCTNTNFQYLDCTKNKKMKTVWCSKSLINCLAVNPTARVYYMGDSWSKTAENVPNELSPDCIND